MWNIVPQMMLLPATFAEKKIISKKTSLVFARRLLI